ncbi:MAG TPA: hypothetical protein PLI45_05105 [Candidatus Woesebacteria bacterium]|nr:hypothetical protein [Candidatus Woesebacteria bacterium]
MVDVVSIRGILGMYSPVGREHLKDGDYFRLPDGRLFHFVRYSPTTDIDPVKQEDIPVGVEIVEMIDQSEDPRFKH